MSSVEFVQLIEFLGEKFAAIDKRFEQVDKRFEQVDRRFDEFDQRLTRVELYGEETRSLVQIVAEGVDAANQRIDDLRAEMNARFAEHRELILVAHRNVVKCEQLEERVRILEARA